MLYNNFDHRETHTKHPSFDSFEFVQISKLKHFSRKNLIQENRTRRKTILK